MEQIENDEIELKNDEEYEYDKKSEFSEEYDQE